MHVYMGIPIHRNEVRGYHLRWWALTQSHGRLAADTLVGMKQLIRSTLAGGR